MLLASMPAGDLQANTPARTLDALADFRRRHVIQQHAVGAGQDGFIQFRAGR